MFPWQQYASTYPHKIALRDFSQGIAFTWSALNEQIAQKVAILKQLPDSTGFAIAISGKNSFALLSYYLAALQCEMPVLLLNPAFPQAKIATLCEQNGIRYWIDCQSDRIIQQWNNPQFSAQSLTLTLTSGSTGTPKAIIHLMQNHLDNAKGVCELMHFSTEDSWLFSLPLYHVSGQGIVWRWLLQGAELILPSDNFYADLFRSTHASLVPTQAQRLLDYWQQHPQSAVQIRSVLLGGSHIPAELTQNLTALGIQAYCGYGMTEMASTVFAKKCDSTSGVGNLLQGREFQIVDNEIWLKGAGLGLGYYAQGKIQPLTNSQGWLQTKDKGYWNGEELYIQGRLDNMFISGGENIQPEEIENLILCHPQVKQVFILPKADEEFGYRPVAFIVFSTEFSTALVDELKLWLSNRIEKFKQPVCYLPLPQQVGEQGAIKISRAALAKELTRLLG
ncbi:o-succinylbenzoate--CoA ligase [Pasteurellaceae bacterium 22721_9_1]